jgi:aarF domain-containing kinase
VHTPLLEVPDPLRGHSHQPSLTAPFFFQELAADLAQITFDYPFRIPPYFALIIRAIGVLEGIALVGDPGFALVDEAYPYLAKRLLTDDTPRLRAALKYMVYGKSKVRKRNQNVHL